MNTKKQFGTRKVEFNQKVQRVWSDVLSGVGTVLLLLLLLWPSNRCLAQQTASAQALTISGLVDATVVTNRGSGYSVPPTVTFVGGGGSGAAAYSVISNGMVVGITNTAAGSGYTSPPTVVIEPPLFDLNDTLVGYWPFDGNMNDATGNGANGTVLGSISYPTGAVGSGAAISGGSYVRLRESSRR